MSRDEGHGLFDAGLPEDERFSGDEGVPGHPLELPLEMYFAREPEDPDASFESSVLDRVERSVPFVDRRERRLISLSRVVIGLGVVAVVGTSAVLDRAGLAPWSDPLAPAPVSRLVESASSGHAEPMTQVALARDAFESSLKDAAAMSAARVSLAAISPSAPSRASETARSTVVPVRAEPAGPYLTAAEPDCPPCAASSPMIVFGDGFRVPGVPGVAGSLSRTELVWPSLEGLAASVVVLDGLPSAVPPASFGPSPMVPVWYETAADPVPSPRVPGRGGALAGGSR